MYTGSKLLPTNSMKLGNFSMVDVLPLNKSEKGLMPNNREAPVIISEAHKVQQNSIQHTIWKSIFFVQQKLQKIAVKHNFITTQFDELIKH